MQWCLYKSCGRLLSFSGKKKTAATPVGFSFHIWPNRTNMIITSKHCIFYFTLCCSNSCLSTVAKEGPRAAVHFLWTLLGRTLVARSLVTEHTKNWRCYWSAIYLGGSWLDDIPRVESALRWVALLIFSPFTSLAWKSKPIVTEKIHREGFGLLL